MPTLRGSDAIDSESIDPGTANRCPQCGARSANVHGLLDCPACSWTG